MMSTSTVTVIAGGDGSGGGDSGSGDDRGGSGGSGSVLSCCSTCGELPGGGASSATSVTEGPVKRKGGSATGDRVAAASATIAAAAAAAAADEAAPAKCPRIGESVTVHVGGKAGVWLQNVCPDTMGEHPTVCSNAIDAIRCAERRRGTLLGSVAGKKFFTNPVVLLVGRCVVGRCASVTGCASASGPETFEAWLVVPVEDMDMSVLFPDRANGSDLDEGGEEAEAEEEEEAHYEVPAAAQLDEFDNLAGSRLQEFVQHAVATCGHASSAQFLVDMYRVLGRVARLVYHHGGRLDVVAVVLLPFHAHMTVPLIRSLIENLGYLTDVRDGGNHAFAVAVTLAVLTKNAARLARVVAQAERIGYCLPRGIPRAVIADFATTDVHLTQLAETAVRLWSKS